MEFLTERAFAKFDLACPRGGKSDILVVLTDSMEIPYFESGMASDFAFKPLDITNPDEWRQTFTAYIVYNVTKDRHEIRAAHSIEKWDEKYLTDQSYIPFDQATDRMRAILGLLKLSEKWAGKKWIDPADS